MGLYKKTTWVRATVTTVGRVIVPPERGPAGSYRKVHLFVRDDPVIEAALDADPDAIDARDSYWCTVPTNKVLGFCLAPGQSLAARSQQEIHELSVMIEHWGP